MTHAYDKAYLEKARSAMGRMLDFAVYDLKYDITNFFELFIASGIARAFEQGDYRYTVGLSGVEMAYEVIRLSQGRFCDVKPRFTQNRSPEYWTGWALAYYQWSTALSFREITRYVPITEIEALYEPYHEMDIRQFVERMDILYRHAKPDTNLKTIRKRRNIAQKELAERSGVPLRTIQQYEQRQKDINKAHADTLLNLASALDCEARELLERRGAGEKMV